MSVPEDLLKKLGPFLSCGVLLFSGTAFASTLYENALPDQNLNQKAGTLRSNIAFTESDPTAEFDGTDVVLSPGPLGGTEFGVTSITTWSIASVLGQPLGDEFSEVMLMYRQAGGTWEVLEEGTPGTSFLTLQPNTIGDSNPDITETNVNYTPLVQNYQSTTGSATTAPYYPIWQTTFNISSLGLQLNAGVDYQFAVWGVGVDPDPTTDYGYWFNSYSNAALSGGRQDDTSGTYLRCSFSDLSGPCDVEDPVADQTWNKGANMNIDIEGSPVPEPSSFEMLGVGLIGLLWFSRKRLKLLADRP